MQKNIKLLISYTLLYFISYIFTYSHNHLYFRRMLTDGWYDNIIRMQSEFSLLMLLLENHAILISNHYVSCTVRLHDTITNEY